MGNSIIVKNLQKSGLDIPDYVPPVDVVSQPGIEKLARDTHDLFLKQGYRDRSPHLVEMVDFLYDYNDKETDFTKAIIEIRKRYNLHMSGTFLFPTYPEMIPSLLPPLPGFPM